MESQAENLSQHSWLKIRPLLIGGSIRSKNSGKKRRNIRRKKNQSTNLHLPRRARKRRLDVISKGLSPKAKTVNDAYCSFDNNKPKYESQRPPLLLALYIPHSNRLRFPPPNPHAQPPTAPPTRILQSLSLLPRSKQFIDASTKSMSVRLP
jgi:hypothetical protein